LRAPNVRLLDLPLRFDHAAARLRAAALDVIYFWEVGTDATNYFLPFCRLAPVQCTGWGWPDTSGAPELDYHLTSEALATPESGRYFSETLVRLPHLPAYCEPPPVQGTPQPPEHFGLPRGAHLYLCAQNLRKAHPDFDTLVAGILRADPQGIVAFVHDRYPAAGERLQQRWAATLADVAGRIALLPRQAPRGYMDLLASAHVVLDTLYFSGANTAYDAVAAGAPAVTLPGEQPRGRYTAALYRSLDMEDLIATSAADYVDIAVRLGSDPGVRTMVCKRLRAAAPRAFENRAAIAQMEAFLADALRNFLREASGR
jgi:predicted O-linked N-acetylglucosamine transferase (SPINDLY family)